MPDAHNALVAALQADVDALVADEDATNAQQTAAQMALDEAETERDAVVMALAEIDRSTTTGRAVASAEDAAEMLEDDRSADTIADAKAAIEAAEEAVGDSDAYDDRIAAAKMAVARAEERNAVDTAVMAAEAAATGLADESGEAAVTTAQGAVDAANMAIEEAEHLTDAEKAAQTAKVTAAQGTVTVAKNANDEATRLAKEEAEAKAKEDAAAKAKEMAAAGKALKAALGSAPLNYLDITTNTGGAGLAAAGLVIDQTQGTLTADPGSVTLRAGASAGSLGDWAGTHYSHTNPGTKVSNSAVVYTNQAAPAVKPFATGATQAGATTALTIVTTADPSSDWEYRASTRTLRLPADPPATTDIKGDPASAGVKFPTTGSQTYPNAAADEVEIRGTYQGARGKYTCSDASCAAAVVPGGGIDLAGQWHFVHDSGATTSKPDSNYLFFGWWLNKDKDDMPTAASAFTGVRGTAPAALTGVNAIPGPGATYSGHAAGKFAISDPIDGGDAGHFTADANLTAKFSGAGAGITGKIDNFMANDKLVPWSVALNNRTFASGASLADPTPGNNIGGAGAITSPDNTTVTPNANDSMTTVWSIDGKSAAASGTWNGQMYDEAPTDGSNVPTTVLGRFQSHFGSTHTMVGAFGATKKD